MKILKDDFRSTSCQVLTRLLFVGVDGNGKLNVVTLGWDPCNPSKWKALASRSNKQTKEKKKTVNSHGKLVGYHKCMRLSYFLDAIGIFFFGPSF